MVACCFTAPVCFPFVIVPFRRERNISSLSLMSNECCCERAVMRIERRFHFPLSLQRRHGRCLVGSMPTVFAGSQTGGSQHKFD